MTKPAPAAPAATAPAPVVEHVTKVLADTYALAIKTHGAHWNVRGHGFFRLHAAFDEQYHELILAADDVAERIRALGANAPASMAQLQALTSLSDIAKSDDDGLVRALRDDHRAISKRCRDVVKLAQEASDEGTADLLIARTKAHDKTAWMLTATLGE